MNYIHVFPVFIGIIPPPPSHPPLSNTLIQTFPTSLPYTPTPVPSHSEAYHITCTSTPNKENVSPIEDILNDLDLPLVNDENMEQQYLDDSKVLQIRNKSCSRPNFAAKLSAEVFSTEERISSNVQGLLGKKKLDPKRIDFIKMKSFQHYESPHSNTEEDWKCCIKAIDEFSRRVKRQMKISGKL